MDPDPKPHLTIVLLGPMGVGKSSAGNTILGRKAFESKFSFGSVTTEISAETEQRFGKWIKVIDTPEILGHEGDVRTFCEKVLQSAEPCLFLVILGTGRFTNREQKAVDAAIKVLGDGEIRNSFLLFTKGDKLKSSLKEWIQKSDRSSLQEVVKRFGDRVHLFDNINKDPDQVRVLLDKTGQLRTWDQPEHLVQGFTVVLLGNCGSGKSASGNKILGRAAFESRVSLKPVTTAIREETGRVFGNRISVVDTPGILRSEKQIQTWIKTLDSSRTVLFLVVVRVGRFTEEDQKAAETVIQVLGTQRFINSYLLFTGGDSLKNSSLENFTSEHEDTPLSGVLQKFGDRIHLFNNEDPGQKEVWYLLRKLGCTTVPSFWDSLKLAERRLVLLGLTGGGRSCSGNTILGSDQFTTDCSSVKRVSVCKSAPVEGRRISVVDTPGFSSRDKNFCVVKEKLEKMIQLSCPGPHVFVFVIRISRISREDFNLLRNLIDGLDMADSNHNMVLFTYGDELRDQSIEELIHSNSHFSELVSMCGGRFCVFDNSQRENRLQVRKFLDVVDEIVEANGGRRWRKIRRDDDTRLDLAPDWAQIILWLYVGLLTLLLYYSELMRS